MKDYNQFVDNLKAVVEEYSIKPSVEWKERAMRCVDGLASEELRSLVALEDRRKSGAFFTSSELAREVIQSYKITLHKKNIFYDPACGAGNLLIAVKELYRDFAKDNDIKLSVTGTDLHKEFVDAAKLRLSILELYNHQQMFEDYSESIVVKDGLLENSFYKKATHILVNPPFNQIECPTEIKWASGKVSAAALFIDAIVNNIDPGTQIIAILPDVLRSGSRYEKWRSLISSQCTLTNIKLLGQFDNHADVDVFSVLLTKRAIKLKHGKIAWTAIPKCNNVVSDLFSVSVGTVVDNRDSQEGTLRPYLISKGLEGWCELKEGNHFRRHKGKSFNSPFLVIKRTSRHGDSHRAVAILVNIPEPVYVDNHLIVLNPLSGKISDCKRLLKKLKDHSTDKWINDQIRCRHLTVKVVSKIPL